MDDEQKEKLGNGEPWRELTDKQKLFIEEYLVDLNATAAAIRAGYSERTAAAIGHDQLRKPLVKEAIDKAMQERVVRTQVSADMVLQELARIGFARLSDFVEFGPDGKIKLKKSDEVDSAVLSEISENDSGGKKVKMHDKLRALELLGKHMGMFTEKRVLDVGDSTFEQLLKLLNGGS